MLGIHLTEWHKMKMKTMVRLTLANSISFFFDDDWKAGGRGRAVWNDGVVGAVGPRIHLARDGNTRRGLAARLGLQGVPR